jgi:hypothetical protein
LLLAGFYSWQRARLPAIPQASLSRQQAPIDAGQLPPLETPSSPYLNTASDAKYVGTERCRQCHADQHETYLQTAHSRSFSLVDPAREPPDGSFDHSASRRRLRSYRQDGQLRHAESLLLKDGGELALADRPLKFLVGSGRFARTYLAEIDGFLVESPLTWYASLDAWRMSPGYDLPGQRSFQRNIDVDCLYCHAGRAESVPPAISRFVIHEMAIGCERCHGPGSVHATQREADSDTPASDIDYSIVNPRRLPRELSEAVCQQCHLESVASVAVRSRQRHDFRPGLAWTDFVVNYTHRRPAGNMTVTGHVEQMHGSRCYQQSTTLTCITCHDPHHTPPPDQRRPYYRAACLACHEETACGAMPALRQAANQDDCAACHMPQSAIDVPHLAFTHHRIGIHTRSAPRAAAKRPAEATLVPLLDVSRLPEIDRRRTLGLGYSQLFDADANQLRLVRQKAAALLDEAMSSGMNDAAVIAARASVAVELGDLPRGRHEAQRALGDKLLAAKDRVTCGAILATTYLREGHLDEAARWAQQITSLRLSPEDWFLLGVCRQRQGDVRGAIQALERVLEIDPSEPGTYRTLVPLYQANGNADAARRALERAQVLEASRPH